MPSKDAIGAIGCGIRGLLGLTHYIADPDSQSEVLSNNASNKTNAAFTRWSQT